ncbi:hypothetical protein GYA49_03975 [Candidatus Beckwithbacteria bacterium]|nr:hypothetical protein [Candidatus Beckwithbacteria bacterium]
MIKGGRESSFTGWELVIAEFAEKRRFIAAVYGEEILNDLSPQDTRLLYRHAQLVGLCGQQEQQEFDKAA